MSKIFWDDGRLIKLGPGDIATCHNLIKGQLYGMIFYNSAGNNVGANLSVIWSNSETPASVSVPGTVEKQGLASVLFVNGTDTDTISVVMLKNKPSAEIQCYIASIGMPLNFSGIINQPLFTDGEKYPFKAFTRYYAVPEANLYQIQLQSNINQFISIQLSKQTAICNVVKSFSDTSAIIQGVGTAKKQYTVTTTVSPNRYWSFNGTGKEFVWINVEHIKGSQNAYICVQPLENLAKCFNEPELQVVK